MFQALVGTTLQVPTIDGRKIPVRLTEVIKPKTSKRIQGEGLPIPKAPNKRGDLIIDFDIQFPDRLSENAKRVIADALPKTSY